MCQQLTKYCIRMGILWRIIASMVILNVVSLVDGLHHVGPLPEITGGVQAL